MKISSSLKRYSLQAGSPEQDELPNRLMYHWRLTSYYFMSRILSESDLDDKRNAS